MLMLFLNHWYPIALLAVTLNVALPPVQIDLFTGCVVIATVPFAVSIAGFEVTGEPHNALTTTVYVPAEVAVYVGFVAPLILFPASFHWYPAALLALTLSCTLPQKDWL